MFMWRRSTWLFWVSKRVCVYLVALLLFLLLFSADHIPEALSILTFDEHNPNAYSQSNYDPCSVQPPLVLYLSQTEHKLKRFLFYILLLMRTRTQTNIQTHAHTNTSKIRKCINTSIKLLQFFDWGRRSEKDSFFGNKETRMKRHSYCMGFF